jgi:acetoin utilization protein AcuB
VKLADYDHMPSVAALMTPFPHFVRLDDPIARVAELMKQHDIRHVPVRDGDRVVGVVAERDLRAGVRPGAASVREIQVDPPYTVELGAPLDTVLREMARRRVATAVVLRSEKLAGIVTATDLCRALAELLEARFRPSVGGDAA